MLRDEERPGDQLHSSVNVPPFPLFNCALKNGQYGKF